ncbi:SGNH/GDSL hydrolase family protein [Paenibacillus cymbidii]|uniref:SGNH/GDSL hydrolase family protein n=1 Tax=Paenibacillus cymbidii TaxID=1639034 RepID=UPI001081904A|nr:SGNH/GDSL hydrolase family protein [Paenibacillus cymbidii]
MDEREFLSNYAVNLTAAHFPAVTNRRRSHHAADLEILLLGDSHGWGQGSPGYDCVAPYTPHMPAPYNQGFYARLRRHLIAKYDWYPDDVANRECGYFADGIETVRGVYHRTTVDINGRPPATGFYAPYGADAADADTFGYLVQDNKFGRDVWVIGPDNRGQALCHIDMKAHARKVYIGVIAGISGGRLEVFFQRRDGSGSNAAGRLYRERAGYPTVTRVERGMHVPDRSGGSCVLQDRVVLDTYRPDADEEVVYCIDYGQKQQGRLCLAIGDASDGVRMGSVRLRGIVFDACAVRNFSMGGHTVGQWLGDGTASYHDASAPHLEQLLAYVPFTPTLTLIQAPIVNEYLGQTPTEAFQEHLGQVVRMLKRHLNEADGAGGGGDILLFTTLGDKRICYGNEPSATIRYEDYWRAARQFAVRSGIGFVDFAAYFRDLAGQGGLDPEFLYDDATHPSPFVNECIGNRLAELVDLVM